MMSSVKDLVEEFAKLITKEILESANVVSASPEFLKKEFVRDEIQTLVLNRIKDGSLASQNDLDAMFATIAMATKALKGVPFSVYVKLSEK